MDVESEAYQKAGPTQREVVILGQEKEAVTMAVITVACGSGVCVRCVA